MAYIKAKINNPITDGSEIKFRSPLEYSKINGLTVCYTNAEGVETSKDFTFVDAHRNDVTQLSDLFVQNAIVSVILDCTNNLAFIQNADTNAYLEKKFENTEKLIDEKIANMSGSDSAEVINNHNNDTSAHADIREALNNKAGTDYVNQKAREVEDKIPVLSEWAKATNKPTYSASEVGAEKEGTSLSVVSSHNTNPDSHIDIRLLINELLTRLNEIPNGTEIFAGALADYEAQKDNIKDGSLVGITDDIEDGELLDLNILNRVSDMEDTIRNFDNEKVDKSDVLTTVEQVSANTSEEKLASAIVVKKAIDSLVRFPDMTNTIYEISDWLSEFTWTVTEDCWVQINLNTNKTTDSAYVTLNGKTVSYLNTTDASNRIICTMFFPCKKGDVIEKISSKATARLTAFGIR